MVDLTSPVPRFPNGDYVIEGVVGKGGMAIVYRARDTRHPRLVAIKVLRPEVAQAIGTTRFLREIAVTAPFTHPHILPLIDSGTLTDEQGRTTPYYVMPLVEGETLHQKLVHEGRLPVPTALRITREILEALEYAHGQGVIHRDIKPANILLSGGHAVVADFGVSRPAPRTVDDQPGEPGLTVTGDVIGTPSYMSPEQALGYQVVDARSDIFSVGCVMYEMLVGDRPFDTPIPQYTATKRRHGIFASARDARADVSPELDALLAKALKADPAERYASAAAFLNAIAKLDEKGSSGWTMLQHPVPNWMRNVAIGALVVVGVIAATHKRNRINDMQAGAVPSLTTVSDKSRVAVLPIESDSALGFVANGIQSDMIDELAQYPALTVISKNGVLQFRGNNASKDTIARSLNVGSLVTGTIKHAGNMVWVTVRLIDGETGVVRSTATDSGKVHDLLAVRSSVIQNVTAFLRTVIGRELRNVEQRMTRSSEAWELNARVQQMSTVENGTVRELSVTERLKRFIMIDSLLARAQALDPSWFTPALTHAGILLQRAVFLEITPTAPETAGTPHDLSPKELREHALTLADRALELSPHNAEALALRGRTWLALWRTARPVAPDSLRVAAERDLEEAVGIRRDMAVAWNDLSLLHQMTGESAKASEDAKQALLADAFLRDAPAVLARRFFSTLATGHVEEARALCASGQRLYPTAPQFWGCELTILGWTATTASDVALAWKTLTATEAKDTAHLLITGHATRRLLVAAIAARAGLPDSAREIIRAVRAAPESQLAPDNVDYGEAYVRATLGEAKLALPLLAKFLRNAPALRGQVRGSPWFAALKSNPDFLKLTAATQ